MGLPPPGPALLGHVWELQLLTGTVSPPPRRLQEEDQQFRTSSLPAIPNPFPELCGPKSPPELPAGSLPPSQAPAKQVSVSPWERQAVGLGAQDGRGVGRGSVGPCLLLFFLLQPVALWGF